MEGIAKTAEAIDSKRAPEIKDAPMPTTSIQDFMGWESVPFTIYNFFNIDHSRIDKKSIDQIKTIYEWAKKGNEVNMGEILKKISDTESRLGAPRIGETRYGKIFN